MANTLRFKRGIVTTIPTAALGEPLFTTDTFDLYIGNGTGNTRFQKYIASGTTSQLLRGDGSLLTMPIVLTSPSNGQVLKFNGTNWVNDSDAGITGSGAAGQVAYFTGATTQGGSNNLFWDNTNGRLGIGTNAPSYLLDVLTNQNAGTISSVSNSTSGTGAFTGFRIGSSANVWLYNFSTGYTTSGRFVAGTFLIDSATSNGININNTNAAPIAFGISNTEGMRLDASRNLLIGNTTGTARLDVQTTAQLIANLASSNVSGGYITLGRTGAASIIGAYSSASGGGTQINADALFFRTTTGIGFSGNGANVKMWLTPADNLVIGSTTDNGLRFQVTGDGFFSGSVGVGTSADLTFTSLRINKLVSGAATSYSILNGGQIQSTVSVAYYNRTIATTQAATFTLNALVHYAANQSTLGAGSTVTNQYGYIADPTLIGATNNYGFYGEIPSGTGRWNLYMNGTAANYINGVLGLGVLPSAWGSNSKPIQMADASIWGSSALTGYASVGGNYFYDGNYKYIKSSTATDYYQYAGEHVWRNAVSGTAGNIITFVQRMTLDASGRLGIGTTSPVVALDVRGEVAIAYNATYGLRFYNDARNNWSSIGNTITGSTDSNLVFKTATGVMTYTGLGRLIIGSAADTSELLQVNGTMRVSGASTFNGAATFNGSTIYNSGSVIRSDNGTATAPAISFDSDLNTGIYRIGADNIGVTTGGALRFNIDATGAATFSSSVTAGGTINTNAGTIFAKASGTEGGQYQLSSLTMGYDATNNLGWITAAGAAARTNLALQGGGGNVLIGTISAISGASSTRFVVVQNQADWTQLIKTNTVTGSSYGLRIDAGTNASDSAISINNASATTNFFNINGTGAATFSSSVTGASFIPTSSTIPTNGMYLSAANTLAFATASGNKLTISSTGLATFTDSARFSNLKGCIFVQTGGSLLGSISMDSSNQVTIDNNGFFGLSVGSNYTMTGGNLGIGHAQFGTSATRTISVVNGTAPSTSPTDAFQMYSNDVVAGNAAPHFRTENGAVIKLYQETTAVGNSTISVGGGNAVLDDTEFDGYTLRQIVRALRNQGILQ